MPHPAFFGHDPYMTYYVPRGTYRMTGLFSRRPADCAVCGARLKHRHRPKKEWNIDGLLCGDCHVQKTKEYYEGLMRQRCVVCGVTKKVTDLWEPRWQWEMEVLLCKGCFDKKESEHSRKKNYCGICGTKMGLLRYRPKPKWKIDGELCRKCWDAQKAELG